MRQQRAQVIVIFAAALPALLGFLGLALDGGYYFAVGRAVQLAASTAARAAAVDVQSARYTSATTDGQAIGQTNVSGLRLSGTSIAIAYNNNDPNAAAPNNCAPTATGWSTTAPTGSARCVRATASGSYATLLLQLVGVPTVNLQRTTVVTIRGVLPLGVCATTAALPVPWVIYRDESDLCIPPIRGWDGYVGLDGRTHSCSEYKAWVLPGPPTGPPPANGSVVKLDVPRRCRTLTDQPDNWLAQVTTPPIPSSPSSSSIPGTIKRRCWAVDSCS